MILNLEEKNLAGQEKKIYSDLTFSQYNHIQNLEEKKLFQHFAILIKIRSTHLLPILDLIIPPLPEERGGYTVLPLSVRLSKNIFRHIFLSYYHCVQTVPAKNVWTRAHLIPERNRTVRR